VIAEDLTDLQRRVFVAVALDGTSVSEVAAEVGSNRNAIYKNLFDARRTLRARLGPGGFGRDSKDRGDR